MAQGADQTLRGRSAGNGDSAMASYSRLRGMTDGWFATHNCIAMGELGGILVANLDSRLGPREGDFL